ncbi:MAG: C39 family peptidase [Puniceicoccales bacterium]|jgi:hypothetical protein|nr:C39 family peptidase [Puniceicoccales bacterium]
MFRVVLVFSFLCCLIPNAHAAGTPLEKLVYAPAWESAAEQFFHDNAQLEFSWNSSLKESARVARPGLLWEAEVPEVIVRFDNGKPVEITFSIFNKADPSNLQFGDRKMFDAYIAKIRAAISSELKTPGQRRQIGRSTNVAQNNGWMWGTPATSYLLEWNDAPTGGFTRSGYRVEFIRLVIASATAKAAAPAARWKGAAHLKTDAVTGDKYIFDIPMVDQGQKGYCADAASERVLRYYGKNIDQHEIAKIAGSSATLGTGDNEFLQALNTIATRLHLRLRVLFNADARFLNGLRTEYNKNARKHKKPLFPDTQSSQWPLQIDGEVIKETRARDNVTKNQFERHIRTCIDQGKPLFWSVQLGWIPEPKLLLQTQGGHMRLIIGYNAKTKQILYSDTWGAGHELKRLPLDDAWAITTALMVLEL